MVSNQSEFCWQDLERILEANGGIREKEPFSLVKVYDRQVNQTVLLFPVPAKLLFAHCCLDAFFLRSSYKVEDSSDVI